MLTDGKFKSSDMKEFFITKNGGYYSRLINKYRFSNLRHIITANKFFQMNIELKYTQSKTISELFSLSGQRLTRLNGFREIGTDELRELEKFSNGLFAENEETNEMFII